MELDPEQLKAKAFLLLQRERELYELRMKHERVIVWLRLTQLLPQILSDAQLGLAEAYRRLRKAFLENLRIQRVLFLAIEDGSLQPLEPPGAPRPLSTEALSLVETQPVGIVNEPGEGAGAGLAEALGLTRFIWSRIDVHGQRPVLLAAGYDRSKAKFYPAFDPTEADNLRNATQYLQGLMRNAAMANELRAANETLEQRVVERTTQLARRNRDMRLVLDNVVTALVTIDEAGRLAEERSAKFDEWFGPYEGSPAFADHIARADPSYAASFVLAHEALIEGTLPFALCLDQFPTQLRSGERRYQCSYRPISRSIADVRDHAGLLIIIDDVTEQRRLAQEEMEQRELLAVFQALTRDRTGFLTFFDEADRLVRASVGGTTDPVVRKRNLHTLKGSAAMMGAKVVADICHRAEDSLAVDAAETEKITSQLQERWAAIRRTIDVALGETGHDIVEISKPALAQLCDDVENGMVPAEVQRRLRSFAFEPVERPMTRLVQHAKALAERLGKPDLSVVVECDGARVDPLRFGNLWAVLVHLVRNAVDHGIESPAERIAAGKAPSGRLVLRAAQRPCDLTVEIEDDGRGVDWKRIAELARARGLPHHSEADLLAALVTDGISIRSTVTSISGRGIGLSAVHQEIARLGGALTVRSESGAGTQWRMVIPLSPTPLDGLLPPTATSTTAPPPAPEPRH